MSGRDELRSKSLELVRREDLKLPSGTSVRVRGLTFGESLRVAELKGSRQHTTQIALTVEEVETGKPMWDANSREDLDEIEHLHPLDGAAILMKLNELSGMGKMAALLSDQSNASSTPSPSDSVEPSGN